MIPGLVSYGVATQFGRLVIAVQPPASVAAGSAFGLTVAVEDASGNVVTRYDASVAISLASNPGGATLGGSPTATVTNGVATFSGLTLNKAGTGYTLRISGGVVASGDDGPHQCVAGFNAISSADIANDARAGINTAWFISIVSPARPASDSRTVGGRFRHQDLVNREAQVLDFRQPVTLTATVKFIGKARNGLPGLSPSPTAARSWRPCRFTMASPASQHRHCRSGGIRSGRLMPARRTSIAASRHQSSRRSSRIGQGPISGLLRSGPALARPSHLPPAPVGSHPDREYPQAPSRCWTGQRFSERSRWLLAKRSSPRTLFRPALIASRLCSTVPGSIGRAAPAQSHKWSNKRRTWRHDSQSLSRAETDG